MIGPIDPNDDRIKKLVQAVIAQQGKSSAPWRGRPVFGGGGNSVRGSASYNRPGFAGINYNPLAAQMASGAPGLLGLMGGTDTNAPGNSPGMPYTGPHTGATPDSAATPEVGVAPPPVATPAANPVLGTQIQPDPGSGASDPSAPPSYWVPDPYDNTHPVVGSADGTPYHDTVGTPYTQQDPLNPYARKPGNQGLY